MSLSTFWASPWTLIWAWNFLRASSRSIPEKSISSTTQLKHTQQRSKCNLSYCSPQKLSIHPSLQIVRKFTYYYIPCLCLCVCVCGGREAIEFASRLHPFRLCIKYVSRNVVGTYCMLICVWTNYSSGSFWHVCLTFSNLLQLSFSKKSCCFCTFYSHTHSKTSLLNCFCRFPRNSPIICLLRPFLSRMKRAIPTGVSDTKPLSIRYWIPFSGFL